MKEFFMERNMPSMAALMEGGYLTYVDFALAAQLTQNLCDSTEEQIACLCHLSAASRMGHLCIVVDDTSVLPPPALIWSESLPPLSEERLNQLESQIIAGRKQLPQMLVTDLPEGLVEPTAVQTPLCAIGNRIYLQKMWMYESLFHMRLNEFLHSSSLINVDAESLAKRLASMVDGGILLPTQATAIESAAANSLTLISGGPGTGKTYTAGNLIRLFWEGLASDIKDSYRIAIAAPTGKAAANLQKSLLRAAGDIPALQTVQATTLHRLLGIRSAQSPLASDVQLAEDLLIVDESSMIDMRMMAALFAAVKPGSRLILLGDKHQLPAVDAGAPFADLIAMQESQSNIAAAQLTHCMRAELKEIIDLASAINSGDIFEAESLLKRGGPLQRIAVDNAQSPSNIVAHLCERMAPHYCLDAKLLAKPEVLMHQSNRFRALAPLKRGLCGVEYINRHMLKLMQKQCMRGAPFIAPVIVVKNDYRLEIYNGEVGLLVRPSFNPSADEELTIEDYVLMPAKDGGIRTLPAMLLPTFEYAYCLSVHKSQGSEFDHVLLLMPEGSENFGREVLYTAVTRARQKLDVWAPPGILEATISRKCYRLSAAFSANASG
jgi:exodeoxyribonuclease V alpha subunit